ncbi:ABC transporter permease [archaeon]|jgi:putative ABC transport system permease protein|nr:ABC transporter permease [archaeon]MBT4416608.1 ABC transporter permease [archaeon]
MKRTIGFAVQSILHRKVRTWLTVIGIIIGIAAIVTLISVSQGLENAITDQFEEMGTNRIYVMPKTGAGMFGAAQGAEGLTEDDVDFLDGFGEIDYINSYLFAKGSVYFGDEELYTNVMGVNNEDMAERWGDMGLEVIDGRFMTDGETGVVIVGYSIGEGAYDKQVYVNNKLEINEEKYKVIGIMESYGNEQDDTAVYVSMDEARIIHGEPDEISFIELVVMEGFDVEEVAEKVFEKMERQRGEEDFEIFTSEQLLAQFSNILNILQVVLGGIAAISLLVGGIGIMNSMFTNVLERKREIGVMKSIGAGPKDIMKIFVVEAGMIGLVGGITGVLVGVLLAFAIGQAAAYAGFLYLDIRVEWWLVVFGIMFAFIVGMISGYLPAKQAAKLLPVEALRE